MLIEKYFKSRQLKKLLVRKTVLCSLYSICGLAPNTPPWKKPGGQGSSWEPDISRCSSLEGGGKKEVRMTPGLHVYTWHFRHQRKPELTPQKVSSNHWKSVKPSRNARRCHRHRDTGEGSRHSSDHHTPADSFICPTCPGQRLPCATHTLWPTPWS